jgi:hypothetical protein
MAGCWVDVFDLPGLGGRMRRFYLSERLENRATFKLSRVGSVVVGPQVVARFVCRDSEYRFGPRAIVTSVGESHFRGCTLSMVRAPVTGQKCTESRRRLARRKSNTVVPRSS